MAYFFVMKDMTFQRENAVQNNLKINYHQRKIEIIFFFKDFSNLEDTAFE